MDLTRYSASGGLEPGARENSFTLSADGLMTVGETPDRVRGLLRGLVRERARGG
jgi:hypothetical protein